MGTKITFDEISRLKSGNATLWHYGVAEVDGKVYDFTLAEMVDNNWSSFEVTWVEETPVGKESVEKAILEEYEVQCSEDDES